jgi:Mg-chelatase subunit ChlD
MFSVDETLSPALLFIRTDLSNMRSRNRHPDSPRPNSLSAERQNKRQRISGPLIRKDVLKKNFSSALASINESELLQGMSSTSHMASHEFISESKACVSKDSPVTVAATLSHSVYSPGEAKQAVMRVVVECPDDVEQFAERANSDLVIVVDGSGSMMKAIPIIRRSIEFLLRVFCDKPGRLGITLFSDDVQILRPLDKVCSENLADEVVRIINLIVATNCTNLQLGLMSGLELIGPVSSTSGAVRAMVLISDGFPTIGETCSQKIVQTVVGHPNAQDLMIFTLAIGSGCDTSLLRVLSAHSPGGSMFEITRDANPGTVLGAMAGVVCYQRLSQTRVSIKSAGSSAPKSLCGITSYIDKSSNEVVFPLAHMAAGERRVVLCSVDLGPVGVSRPSIHLRAKNVLSGGYVEVEGLCPPCLVAEDAVMESFDPIVDMEIQAMRGLQFLISCKDCVILGDEGPQRSKLISIMDSLQDLEAKYASLQGSEELLTRKKVHEVVQRIAWCLEVAHRPKDLCQLIRTTTTDMVEQRSTTYQATKNCLEDASDDDDLAAPSLARTFSAHARSFTQDLGQEDGSQHSQSDELSPTVTPKIGLMRSFAMGEMQLRSLAKSEKLSMMPPPMPVLK